MKWKIIGKILILDKDYDDLSKSHLESLRDKFHVKSIVKIDHIEGSLREPKTEILLGDSTETIHKENGCYFKLDLSKVMWAKGNTNERMRIAKLVKDDEVVMDMFAGIGYFSIPIGVHANPRKVYSIELNPNSYEFLKTNIELNKINQKAGYEKMVPILGDCRFEAPKYKADRILMGYVKITHEFLPTAIGSLNPGGIIHYHETVPEKLMYTRPVDRIKEAAGDREVNVLNFTKVKKYSPGVMHIVVDAQIE
ncbi:MAG: class I SAM-dependent methyltransferase [Methanobrevibacter boviskoreani]|jgi:tRNA wybutosine-synthesizing protein 2|uniref:class I SAM-dependent methyltransferase n=1 Tax=Methanobrevibacter boviskoreani TaxID=1348249 RepID=UPI00059487B9|nr:class I SAM-dependent methyltransferase family protein [Methanobrevibacter boviskoreani]MDD6256811.1 class I SAM-dependent methyltransferase family protein [Methanobrevibacter boviskoreani]